MLEVVVHGDDVRVAQRSGDARFPQESVGERGIRSVERTELLESDVAVEIRLAREVDDGHSAATHLAEDLVPTDFSQNLRRRHSEPFPPPR